MWIVFAILGAFSKALTSTFRKKLSTTDSSIYVFVSYTIVSLLLLLITIIMPNESISSVANAPLYIILVGFVHLATMYVNQYAFKYEELSYITPMFALTPIYTILLAFVIVGEIPTWVGALGIAGIVLGGYIATSAKNNTILETISHIAKNKGARAGMLLPILFAAFGSLNKEAIVNGVTPIASVAASSIIVATASSHVLLTKFKTLSATLRDPRLVRLLIFASLAGVGSVGFSALALEGAITSYVLSIRRLDVLITILIGWKIFGDSNTKRRLIGGSIMIAGVFLIALS
jgi:drug/metabolite transporter (DMT)-like permease